MRLNGKTLRAKFPLPRARWHGAYPNVDATVKAAIDAGVPTPFTLEYLREEQ